MRSAALGQRGPLRGAWVGYATRVAATSVVACACRLSNSPRASSCRAARVRRASGHPNPPRCPAAAARPPVRTSPRIRGLARQFCPDTRSAGSSGGRCRKRDGARREALASRRGAVRHIRRCREGHHPGAGREGRVLELPDRGGADKRPLWLCVRTAAPRPAHWRLLVPGRASRLPRGDRGRNRCCSGATGLGYWRASSGAGAWGQPSLAGRDGAWRLHAPLRKWPSRTAHSNGRVRRERSCRPGRCGCRSRRRGPGN